VINNLDDGLFIPLVINSAALLDLFCCRSTDDRNVVAPRPSVRPSVCPSYTPTGLRAVPKQFFPL